MQKIEKNTFLDVIGYSPKARILDTLIEGRGLDFSLTDITENAQIGWTSLHRLIDELIENKLIIHTRKIGKAKMYQINHKNPIAQKLIELHHTVILKTLDEMGKDAKKQEKKVVVKH